MADFVKNIRAIIKSKGLKFKFVAEKLDLSEKTFSAMLTGRQRIVADDITRICDVLEVTPNELFGYKLE